MNIPVPWIRVWARETAKLLNSWGVRCPSLTPVDRVVPLSPVPKSRCDASTCFESRGDAIALPETNREIWMGNLFGFYSAKGYPPGNCPISFPKGTFESMIFRTSQGIYVSSLKSNLTKLLGDSISVGFYDQDFSCQT